jgi:hypothetical protein
MTETETRIVPIPPHMVVTMWPYLKPFIRKGLRAATDLTMIQIVDDISAGTDQLWAIFVDGKPCGAFITALLEEPTSFYLGVYALGGRGLDRWADLLGETMAAYGMQVGASCVRFHGREAWSRVLPSYHITGRNAYNGHALFERTLQ